jgi:hypothetical protein
MFSAGLSEKFKLVSEVASNLLLTVNKLEDLELGHQLAFLQVGACK